jgi:pectinesterase
MKRLYLLLSLLSVMASFHAANRYDNPDTLFVARDGTAEFRNVDDAIEVCRAFMDYHKVIYVKKGVYKEKLTVPSWLSHIEICGEDRDSTIITYDDHANIKMPGTDRKMGTFRTYTLKIQGNYITLKNITIENNAARLGQAVALHTEGDHLVFLNCRFLGNQDTVYTGTAGTRLYFKDCLIEGTTDFIFGPSTAWFEHCMIKSKLNSYITAASTPSGQAFGYVFNHCRLVAAPGVDHVYLGRPWRPYSCVIYMNCEMGRHICPEGWDNWRNPENEKTARYSEYHSTGEGAKSKERVSWSHQLSKADATSITLERVFRQDNTWVPAP